MASKTLDGVVSINTDDTLHKPNTNLLRSFVIYLKKNKKNKRIKNTWHIGRNTP